MHQDMQTICEALDRLADSVVTAFPHQTDQLFSDYWTWQVPSMNRRDLSLVVRSIADDLSAYSHRAGHRFLRQHGHYFLHQSGQPFLNMPSILA